MTTKVKGKSAESIALAAGRCPGCGAEDYYEGNSCQECGGIFAACPLCDAMMYVGDGANPCRCVVGIYVLAIT